LFSIPALYPPPAWAGSPIMGEVAALMWASRGGRCATAAVGEGARGAGRGTANTDDGSI